MYKLVFFVPESHLEQVKTAVFNAGAGQIGNYDQCCWQIAGAGQFRPLASSHAFIGQLNKLEQVTEYRVEMVCADAFIRAAVKALRLAHPYEEPAIDVWQLAELES
ncbi:MAG: NGG1p interacting factor NIF3 [Gammaproteobacteria bacterium]|nr:MAG: NGG1p interacting factor NIF3 [Gammaproteobacteria bacterium]